MPPATMTTTRGIAESGHASRVSVVRCIVASMLAAVVVAGLVALVFWLEYTVTHAAVRHLNATGAAVNATFYLTVAVDNPNRRVSMRYDRVAFYVYYGEESTQLAVADVAPGSWRQPSRNETVLQVRAVARSAPVAERAARELERDVAAGEVGVEVCVSAGVRFVVGGVALRYYHIRGSCSPVNIGLAPAAARSFNSVPCDVEI